MLRLLVEVPDDYQPPPATTAPGGEISCAS
jgi:hypothetical protein